MKTLNIYAALLFSIFAINFSFAQTSTNTETIRVSGNCGMCKNKIEKSAKSAGATAATWNAETQILSVSYASGTTSEKIQKAVAASGYDTQNFKADDKAYSKLMGCCKYERNTILAKADKVSDCKNMDCCKASGKNCCTSNFACTNSNCKAMAECKDMACCKS